MANFAKRYNGSPDDTLRVVGVTGTNGKTTVTTLTRHLLEEPGKPVGLIGTVRYHLGTGRCRHLEPPLNLLIYMLCLDQCW